MKRPLLSMVQKLKFISTSTLILVGLLISVLVLLLAHPVWAEEPPESMPPSTIIIESGTVPAGETIQVAIDLQVPAPDNLLTAVTINIQYDPTILDYQEGSCLTNNTDFQLNLCNESDGDGQPPDVIFYSALSLLGVNGDLNLGEIPFTAVTTGASELIIEVRTFEDGSGESPNVVNGMVEVGGPTAIHLRNLSAAPSPGSVHTVLVIFALLTGITVISRFRLWKR